ncbi:hypothetical protein ACIBKX_32790 [Streptomyces sp. NPDC050658]|uniref:hypothetical protein n=1 Tax=unclassified Streptomyces TaxID=2593676 RepID=UPI0034336D3B
MERRDVGDGVLLLVGEEQVAVEAHLGDFHPSRLREWGGVLHRVPSRLVLDLDMQDGIRLRLPNGQERSIHPLGIVRDTDEEFVSVYFSGEETLPF